MHVGECGVAFYDDVRRVVIVRAQPYISISLAVTALERAMYRIVS
jgi:hypothetical protein